jgi:hypothetical protein
MSEADSFFDTNVLLYLLSKDTAKADRAEVLLASGGIVSQHRWRPRGRKTGGRWTCVTRKSRVLRSRGAPRLPPETSGILGI